MIPKPIEQHRARLLLVPALLALASCWTVSGNLHKAPIRPGEPPAYYQIDEEASSVDYTSNYSASESYGKELRSVTRDLLQARSRPAETGGPVVPARFRLKVESSTKAWPHSWYWVCTYFGQFFGCPTGKTSVEVHLELQVGTDVYSGEGKGGASGGWYYYALTGSPKATAAALEQAIQKLALVRSIGTTRK